MAFLSLSSTQTAVAAASLDRRIFLEGIAGTGKTTAGVARLLRLLAEHVPADAILVVVPQRTLTPPYADALRGPAAPAGGEVTIVTPGGLAQRMVELFWPLVAGAAGFGQPNRPPTFLTLETAQYFMARVVGPALQDGFFDSINLDRNRILSQVLDNLNKAAIVGFPTTEIGSRLKAAWLGESAQLRVFDEVQTCADRFRAYCLEHNLLDFSLQFELFARHLWPLPACRDYLTRRYTHLIIENAEEEPPVAHDILAEWLPTCRSALVIYDWEAGYRRFLGADPASAYRLKPLCDQHVRLAEPFVASPEMRALDGLLARALGGKRDAEPVAILMGRGRAEEMDFLTPPPPSPEAAASEEGKKRLEAAAASPDANAASRAADNQTAVVSSAGWGARPPLVFTTHRFHPQMLDWVADEIADLVHGQGVPPGEIAVLAPFVGGGLRFSLENRLAERDVPLRSHRPSRALREEPVTLCLLTLAALAYPSWGILPAKSDVTHALALAIADLDLVRGQLLVEIAYRVRDGQATLGPFSDIEPAMQERITFLLGGRYEALRTWLAAQREAGRGTKDEGRKSKDDRDTHSLAAGRRSSSVIRRSSDLDHFLGRLFGELLSQPGFGFHGNFAAGEVTANVIESARKFRDVMGKAVSRSAAELPSVMLNESTAQGALRRVASEASPSSTRLFAGDTPSSTMSRSPAQSDIRGPTREGTKSLGQEYVELVREGVVAAQYVRSWRRQPADAVLLAPAHTFLMSNRPVDHQFWLDVGSTGWRERLNQPLPHPYVLSRSWDSAAQWPDLDEYAARREALYCLALGLVRRCRVQVHLGLSELGEQGSEQRGPLLRAIQRVLRESSL